jgi:hypothetical protein
MKCPPMLLHLRIPTGDGFIGLWLPWFLVYLLLLILMLIALPFAIILAIIFIPTGKWRPLILAGPYVWRLLFNMKGLKVDIQKNNRKLMFNFI